MPAKQQPDGVDSACQLELFDEALADPHREEAEPLVMNDRRGGSHADLEALPTTAAEPSEVTRWGMYAGTDRAVLKALEGALANARAAPDDRPPLVLLASCLGELRAPTTPPPDTLRQARDDWLRRLETQRKSESTLVGYRSRSTTCSTGRKRTGATSSMRPRSSITWHSYQERAQPAEASYYRRFVLLRKFVRWVCRRDGVPDLFVDLGRRRSRGRSATG